MPVDSKHPQWQKFQGKWDKCRTVIEGEEAVKEAGVQFLPRLSTQNEDRYQAYKMRASWFGGTERTLEALLGMSFRKAPEVEWPESKRFRLEHISYDGEPLETLAQAAVAEVFTTGRVGLLADAGDTGVPYVSIYTAESIINWRVREVEGRQELAMVVLAESHTEPEDEFCDKEVPQIRVLDFDESGSYFVEVYRFRDKGKGKAKEEWILEDTYAPAIRGVRLRHIPFIIINTRTLGAAVEKPPLLGLANINLSLYRSSADLEHGRHICALPTPWAAGFKIDKNLTLGPEQAWVTSNERARAGFLEFTGTGLKALETAMGEKKGDMAVLGARLLEADKAGVEAADTHRMRKMSESGILAAIQDTTSRGITQVLRWAGQWDGIMDEGAINFTLSDDFMTLEVPADTLRLLMEGVIGGTISYDTFFFNLQRGELLPEGTTIEDERALIEAGVPMPGLQAPPPDDTEEEEEDEGDEDLTEEPEEEEES